MFFKFFLWNRQPWMAIAGTIKKKFFRNGMHGWHHQKKLFSMTQETFLNIAAMPTHTEIDPYPYPLPPKNYFTQDTKTLCTQLFSNYVAFGHWYYASNAYHTNIMGCTSNLMHRNHPCDTSYSHFISNATNDPPKYYSTRIEYNVNSIG